MLAAATFGVGLAMAALLVNQIALGRELEIIGLRLSWFGRSKRVFSVENLAYPPRQLRVRERFG